MIRDDVMSGVLNSNASGNAATSIFFAYVDTYIGKHLLRQFFSNRKAGVRQNIVACTWDKEGADQIADEVSAEESVSASVFVNMSQCAASKNTETASSAVEDLLSPAAATKVIWRGDIAAMRRAFIECDKIIIEMRQAQDIFDMIHVLTKKEILHTKRIIVISSILTWYATPPLQVEPPEVEEIESPEEDDNDNGGAPMDDEEAEEEFDGACPVNRIEEEALLGPSEVVDGEEDDDSGSNTAAADEMEIFTEDQYNRRVPHVKFYNWRDAERAVAAAHGEERRLETFVIFAGLPYGSGEGPLEPLFAQAWNRGVCGLPVYGDGKQIVPTVHVRDLATFTMRLIDAEEPPASRYLFGVDGGTTAWGHMVRALNRAFGGEVTYIVRPEDYVLHRNVELFTMNLRLDNQTMRELMPEDEDWVAQSGFVVNAPRIAHEYVVSHHLEPMRIAVLGPPLSGKSVTAMELGKRQYQLPVFNIEQVVEDYKKHIAEIQGRLEAFRQRLRTAEETRRVEAKRRAFLRRGAHKPNAANDEEEADGDENPRDDDDEGGGGGGEDEEEGKKNDTDTEEKRAMEDQANKAAAKGERGMPPPIIDGGARQVHDMEVGDMDFALTEEETREVDALVDEWQNQSERVQQLRETIAAMERVLAMRIRQQPPALPDALAQTNPKRRREQARSKRAGKGGGKGRDDGAPAADADASLAPNAPFQDRALALMLRWRLRRADCRNQGYVLDGFPETVAQARLAFHEEPLEMPATIEGALAGSMSFAVEPNAAPATAELCDEARLPDHVIVLEAADNFVLDRLALMAAKSPGAGDAVAEEKRLTQFKEALATYHRQFTETDYSLANFFECARTAKSLLMPGGRAPTVTLMRSDTEPLELPPPPASAYVIPPVSSLASAIFRNIGSPRNMGPTPQQHYEEEVRERNLLDEEHQEANKVIAERCERERREAASESAERSTTEEERELIELADRAALEARKAPLRDYLRRNIVPLLSKGLVEVCKTRPKDPVDFLAEWLTRHNPLDDTCLDL